MITSVKLNPEINAAGLPARAQLMEVDGYAGIR
jgi:hypothetical protein